MSEFKKTRDVSTSKKLQPPRSLQGEEDAESTWDLILTRYPNAAPLLCQMETVIDRAEGLLQQLRSPYTHVLEKSSSFQIADSEDELMGPCHIEESTEVSMISEQDSRPGSMENMTPEVGSLPDKISADDYRDGKSNLERVCGDDETSRMLIKPDASAEEEIWSNDLSSASISDRNLNNRDAAQELEIRGQKRGLKSPVSSVLNVSKIPMESEDSGVAKSSSLEAWGKVVGENFSRIKNSKPFGSRGDSSAETAITKEDSVSEHARRLNYPKNGPMQQITKINLLGKKDELMQRFAGTIATASKVLDAAKIADKKTELGLKDPVNENQGKIDPSLTKINERGEQTLTNSSGNVNGDIEELGEKIEASSESIDEIQKRTEPNEVQGNGDEAGPETGPRSPVDILDDYSKICGIPVEYKNLGQNRSYKKNVVVKCCFGGFSFEVCAQSKKIGKREAAGKLLRYLAGRQIDGENMAGLIPFSRKQIREIISLGNGGEHETAVRKLYEICIELDAPEPVYTVHQDSGIVGNRYTAKCGALGITTSGFGIRILVAKRVAADALLQIYFENRRTSTN